MPRLTLEFNPRMTEILEELAKKEQTTKVDVIRRALALYKFVEEEVAANPSRKVSITENDKVVKQLVIQ